MKNEKGITLASLTLTIIILIILSAVAINSGVGTIRYTKFNKAKSEIEIMQTNVNSWYQEYMNVKYEEGATEEETQANKLAKQQEVIDKYGVDTSDSSCDQTALTKTVNATGITSTDYKFLSASYIKNNLGLDASFDYLINIPSRSVILFNGVKYNGDTYYTTEDFGILKIESVSFEDINFDLSKRNNTEVIINNLKLIDSNNNEVNINKFDVEYKKDSDTAWINATSRIVKFIEDNETKYKFSIADGGKYSVKISTTDKKIEKSQNIFIGILYRLYVSQGLVMQLDGIENSENGHSNALTDTWYNIVDSNNNATIVNGCTIGENYIRLDKNSQQYITTNLEVFDKTYTIEMLFSPKSFYNYNALWAGSGLRKHQRRMDI